jgi:hypothetical protein
MQSDARRRGDTDVRRTDGGSVDANSHAAGIIAEIIVFLPEPAIAGSKSKQTAKPQAAAER